MKKEAEMKLAKAKVRLLLDHPFFGSLVFQHETELTDAIPTAAATQDGRIQMNPGFVEGLETSELVFLLAHEVMHIVYAHAMRRGSRDHETFNIACDAVINETLILDNVGKFIEGGVRLPGAESETAERIYDKLNQNATANANAQGGGNGNGNDDGSGGSGVQGNLTIKDLDTATNKDGGAPSETDVKAAIAEGKMKIAQAANVARMQGKLGSTLGGLIGAYLDSKLPWWDILERYMVSKASQRYNWNRPNKRMLRTAYMPRRERFPSMGEVVIGIDVSGSISTQEIQAYIGHCKAIFEQCHPSKVYVVYCSAQVEQVDEFDSCDEIIPQENQWYGGTHMPAIMDWIDANDIDADVCITFTDGYTDYPTESQVPCDLVWVLSTDYKPDGDTRGEVIYAVEEDY